MTDLATVAEPMNPTNDQGEIDMSEPAYHWNFTQTCQTCGETVEYVAGQRKTHPCSEALALVIEGCNTNTGLVKRVEQALADYDALTKASRD